MNIFNDYLKYWVFRGLYAYSGVFSFFNYYTQNTFIAKYMQIKWNCFMVTYKKYVQKIKTEPLNNWGNISCILTFNSLVKNNKNTCNENYVQLTYPKNALPTNQIYVAGLNVNDVNMLNNEIILSKLKLDKTNQHPNIEKLLTIKYNDYYFTKKIKYNHSVDCFPLNFIPSDVQFLTIEYHHPTLKEPIPIHLTKMKLVVGSEILTPIFIQRYFEYTYGNIYCVKQGYILEIIDKNIHSFQLNENQHILLGKGIYLVK
jgi:hypothetical protein